AGDARGAGDSGRVHRVERGRRQRHREGPLPALRRVREAAGRPAGVRRGLRQGAVRAEPRVPRAPREGRGDSAPGGDAADAGRDAALHAGARAHELPAEVPAHHRHRAARAIALLRAVVSGAATPGPDKPIPAVLKYAEWVDQRPKLAALLLVLLSMPALYLSVIFFADVRAGLTELLPPDAPSAKALAVLHDKLGGFAHMVVVAESDNADANRRFIVELGDRLEKRHVPEIRVLQKDTKVETEWARNRALLLMPQEKFDEAIGKAEEAIAKAKRKANPMLVDLEDDDEQKEDPKAAFEGFREKLKDEIAKADQFPNGL